MIAWLLMMILMMPMAGAGLFGMNLGIHELLDLRQDRFIVRFTLDRLNVHFSASLYTVRIVNEGGKRSAPSHRLKRPRGDSHAYMKSQAVQHLDKTVDREAVKIGIADTGNISLL